MAPASESLATEGVPPRQPHLISKGGEEVDFEALFVEMAPYILRVVPRMGIAVADVDDVAQEVFLAVHRGLSQFEGRSTMRTWIYGICIRVCADHRRKLARKREVPLADTPRGGSAPSPERQLVADRSLRALDTVLGDLPDAQRAAFVLFEVEGLSMHEVSAALDCPLFTAYARLYAARRRVRAGMAEHLDEEL